MKDEPRPQAVEQRSQPPKKTGNGKEILKVIDPQGFEIVVDLETWEKHIIKGHPEMKNYLDLLGKTIEGPEVIQRSDRHNETYYYYRLTGRTIFRRDDIYLSAVVHRNDAAKTGFVKTAHLVKSIRKGGEAIWIKRN